MLKMAQQTLPRISHVIFDLDGLLIDTESVYTRIFDDLCMRWVSKHFDFAGKNAMMGRRMVEALSAMKQWYNIPQSVPEIQSTMEQYAVKMLPTADFMPGAQRLVRHFYDNGIPMAIATGSNEEEFACKTSLKTDFFEKYFQHVVLSSDPAVKCGKPAPDVFLLAAKRFKTPPVDYSRCIVFEDSSLGIQAALAAGMCAVWVPSQPEQNTSELPAHAILPTLEHFEPGRFGLPAFNGAPSF